jgi:hypothetical protein
MSNIKLQPSGAFHIFRSAAFGPLLIYCVSLARPLIYIYLQDG